MDWLEKKSFTTLFVDGNHENFDRLNQYPVEEWSVNRGWQPYRINHVSWWKEELPTEEEMEEGRKNLTANGNEVDFIVSHCCASSTQVLIGGSMFERDYLNEYLEEIRQSISFKKWFFGHYHNNKNVNTQEILLYEQIIRIG